jgi:hypothetical protein
MSQNRRGSDMRIDVDLPVRCVYEDEKQNRKVTLWGRIKDLSINGMKLMLPLSSEIIENQYLDFDLDLPNPFSQIKGHGEIQWKQWDKLKNYTACGLKLEPMTLKQLSELDTIIAEVAETRK